MKILVAPLLAVPMTFHLKVGMVLGLFEIFRCALMFTFPLFFNLHTNPDYHGSFRLYSCECRRHLSGYVFSARPQFSKTTLPSHSTAYTSKPATRSLGIMDHLERSSSEKRVPSTSASDLAYSDLAYSGETLADIKSCSAAGAGLASEASA